MAKSWYIVHTHTGFENKVKATLEERIKMAGQEESFGEILVPTEQVVEMVKGARKTSERKFFPGYILVNMEMNEHTWHIVQETPRVTGFVGINMSQAGLDKEIYKKIPSLTDKEALKILGRIADGASKPKPKVVFGEGDSVRVIDGLLPIFKVLLKKFFRKRAESELWCRFLAALRRLN